MERSENSYIEVIGEGSYFEEVSEYVVDLGLEVRAAKDDTAIAEISDLRDTCIQKLVASGIGKDEIIDSGGEVWRPWFRRRKVAKEAHHKITIKTPDVERLSKALSELEAIFANKRHNFTIDMRQPVYDNDLTAAIEAQKHALTEARAKANALATEANVRLGSVIRIEELAKTKRSSGAFGDDDWSGDSGRFALAAGATTDLAEGAVAEEPVPTESPKRTIWVRYRVRFAIDTA